MRRHEISVVWLNTMISLNNVVKVGHWLTALFLIFVFTTASAQKSNTVTGNFSAATFESFVKSIEEQTNFKFYYDHLQTDSLSITVNASNDSISKVLDLAFTGTPLHYSVYGNNV